MFLKFLMIGSADDVAARAEVPLQIADPQHQVGDGRGPRVDLDPQELVRIDLPVSKHLLLGNALGTWRTLRLQPLQLLQRDVEEVAAAAGRVEHAGLAELLVER